MCGVFQNTVEQDALETTIKSYFADDLPSFVNGFKGNDVFVVEDKISMQLAVSLSYSIVVLSTEWNQRGGN